MRGQWLVLLALVLLAGTALGQPVSDPAKTNVILTVLETPHLAPGERGEIRLAVRNPYEWAMENVSLRVEVYAFVHRQERVDISELANPPGLGVGGSPAVDLELGTLAAGVRVDPTIAVRTLPETPGGTVFTQGTYHVRFRLEFDYEGGLHAVMVSSRFYSAEEWAFATRDVSDEERAAYRYVGFVNYTYLGERLGLASIDGVLPDSVFFVKDPLPIWPFQLLAVGAAASFGGALYYVWRERREGDKPINRPRP